MRRFSHYRGGRGRLSCAPALAALVAGLFVLQPAKAASFFSTGTLTDVRSDHTATLLPNGLVLVAGGYDGAYLSTATAELYDPATGTWATTGGMTDARSDHTATLLPNGQVLVAGGDDYSGDATELYDPATETWVTTGSMRDGRAVHTATLLPNGFVLVAGGTFLSHLPTAELYDPATGSWTNTGSMISSNFLGALTARFRHKATLLTNGLVLVTGGALHQRSILLTHSSTELYNPATGTWKTAGGMTARREYHTATLLANGQVLIAGGYNNLDQSLSSAELYDADIVGGPVTSSTLSDIRRLADGSFQFNFTNIPGALFSVLATTNLALPSSNWTVLGGVIEVSSGQSQFTDTQATNHPQRFYRLRSP